MSFQFSDDAAISGGIVSAALLWLVRILLGSQFSELMRVTRETQASVANIDRRLAYLEGREAAKADP